jgi:RNA polymerase sigma factor for flagellar operon FliA
MRMTQTAVLDRSERDALVLAHVDLVRTLASRLGRRLPAAVEHSELVSVGVLGLIDAASRYQPALGVPFDAFARRRIHGAMLDSLRRLDCVPRSVRRMQRTLADTLAALRARLGREPGESEVAEALGMTPEEYDRTLDELRSVEIAVVRQHSGGRDNSGGLLDVVLDPAGGPHAMLERRELRRAVAEAIARLPDRERHILALYYEEELTLAEIGAVIGVGESRVSQLRTQAIARLRSLLQDWLQARGGRR